MADQTANAGDQSANVDQTQENNQDSKSQTESVNERLLRESKEWKSKAMALKAAVEAREKKDLEEQGKYKEALDKERADKESITRELVKTRMFNAVYKSATKVGCTDVDAVMRLGDQTMLDMDENGNISGVEPFIESVKKSYPMFFQTANAPNITKTTPQGNPGVGKKLTAIEIAKLPQAERVKIMQEMWSKR